MKTQFLSAALALATVTAASSAFAGDSWSIRDNYQAPVHRPDPRYHLVGDYGSPRVYRPTNDDYRPVYQPKRYGYGY